MTGSQSLIHLPQFSVDLVNGDRLFCLFCVLCTGLPTKAKALFSEDQREERVIRWRKRGNYIFSETQ